MFEEGPGGKLATRPLQFIWIADCSGSMQGSRIDALNLAIREAIKPMQDVAAENPNAEVMVRAVKFSDNAVWHLSQPTNISKFKWVDLTADGETRMGEAIELVAAALMEDKMPERGLPPVLVLISDGRPTDDFNRGLKKLLDQPWGLKSVRISVAIGDDADLETLHKFMGSNPELKPLFASNVQDLVNKIKWASTVPLKAASNPASRLRPAGGASAGAGSNVVIPAPPPGTPPTSPADAW